ncbi:hypothetical protein DFH11DRAFT_65971 [Phellopilus nigrolimitatus]|nr:hypothetical protein DFH11DRAFT_65971 [Phellopilus nigrolimitatus]
MPVASKSASPSSSRSRLSATSSNSSPSGHAEQSTGPTTKRNSNERPETRISEEDCFAQSAQTDVFLSSHRTGKTRTMPQRIVLREDAPTSTFTVLTVGWELLLVFCSQNAATRIEAEGGDEGKLLCVSLEEGDGAVITNSAEAPALRLFRPERSDEFAPSMPGCSLPPPSFSAANVFVKLTLSLGSANFGEYRTPNMAFILPLPTTFEKIAEYSTRVRSGRA